MTLKWKSKHGDDKSWLLIVKEPVGNSGGIKINAKAAGEDWKSKKHRSNDASKRYRPNVAQCIFCDVNILKIADKRHTSTAGDILRFNSYNMYVCLHFDKSYLH